MRFSERFPALASRDFFIFWVGQFISLIGTWMQSTTLPYLAYRLSGRPLDLGLIGFSATLPTLLFALPGGVWVEHLDKRKAVIVLQAIMMLQALALAALTFSGAINIAHIILLAFVLGAANAIEITARQSMLVELVGKPALPNAIALQSTAFNLARVLGPSLTAVVLVLVKNHGEGWAFLINGASFLFVLVGLLFVRTPYRAGWPAGPAESRGMTAQFQEGWRYIRGNAVVLPVIVLATLIGFFGFPFGQQIPAIARDVLARLADTEELIKARTSGLYLAQGVGALAAALIISSISHLKRKGLLMTLGQFVFAICLMLISLVHALPLGLVLIGVLGWAMVSQLMMMNTLIQLEAPDALRGRVFSVYLWGLQGVAPFGSLFIGWLAQSAGVPMAALACGCACLLALVAVHARWPGLRKDTAGGRVRDSSAVSSASLAGTEAPGPPVPAGGGQCGRLGRQGRSQAPGQIALASISPGREPAAANIPINLEEENMTDPTDPSNAPTPAIEEDQSGAVEKKRRLMWVIVLLLLGLPLLLLVVVGGYFLSGYIVSRQIEKSYASADCSSVVSTGQVVESIYPPSIMPYVQPALEELQECLPYVEAVAAQAQGDWETANADYVLYLDEYPQGIVAPLAREGAAQVLFSWSEDLQGSQDYAAAVEKLSLLLEEYPQSSLAGQARESIAQALLDWAEALQDDRDFAGAAAKLEQILAAYGNTAPAGRARTLLPQVYLDWGNAALSESDFPQAMAQFDKAEQYASAQMKAAIAEARTRGQMAWAQDLSDQEQFGSSLDHLEAALEGLPDEALAAEIDSLRTEILVAFSGSSGAEAQKFMQDAGASACSNHQPGLLPILGVNPDEVRIYSSSLKLPNNVRATTPGNMHYAACVRSTNVRIETCAYESGHWVYRERIDRIVELVNAATGRTYTSRTFNGTSPEACQFVEMFYGSTLTKTGAAPADAVLIGWLQSFTK